MPTDSDPTPLPRVRARVRGERTEQRGYTWLVFALTFALMLPVVGLLAAACFLLAARRYALERAGAEMEQGLPAAAAARLSSRALTTVNAGSR